MRVSPLAGLVALTLAGATNALAESNLASEVLAAGQGLKAAQAEAPKLRQESDALVARNEQLKREYDIYANQVKTRLGPIADAIKAEGARYQAEVTRHNQGVAQHNAGCTGELPQPQYQRCQGQKAYWDQSKANLDQRQAALKGRVADYERQYRQYSVRMDQIGAEMKRNFAAWEQRKQALGQLQKRVEALQARFSRACNLAVQAKNRGEPSVASNAEEALHHCHAMNWDGAGAKDPLVDVKPPSSVTPN